MVYTPAMYRANRDALLQHILATLNTDERFVAAWLTGSLARDEEDDLSDLDLSVVVADAHTEQFCSCSPVAITNTTSPERQALYEQFGQPLVLCEDRGWLGEGSCFNHVSYRQTAQIVDWVFLPQAKAQRPAQSRVLFDNVGIPIAPHIVESLEERVAFYQNTSVDATAQVQQAAQLQIQIDQDNATVIALLAQQDTSIKQLNAAHFVENGLGHNIHSSYDAATNTYTFIDTIGEQPSNGAYERAGKQAIFNIELTMLLGSLHPNAAYMYVLDPSGVTLLTATLHKITSSRLNWNNLDAESAWNAYDTVFISPSLSNQ